MGDYTKFYGVIKLNTDLKNILIESMNQYSSQFPSITRINTLEFWDIVYEKTKAPEIKEFCEDDRCNFIPYSDYGDFCTINTPAIIEDNLIISCDLKNYNGTIEFFIEKVLPLFSNNYYLYKLTDDQWIKDIKPYVFSKGTMSKKETEKYFHYQWRS